MSLRVLVVGGVFKVLLSRRALSLEVPLFVDRERIYYREKKRV